MKQTQTTAIITLFIAVSLLAVPALASEGAPSTIPHAFYGQVHDANGSNAPAGAIVVASVAGTSAGTITVTPAGQYGTDYEGGYKLIVWTPALCTGDKIVFFIDGVRADESVTYESGGVTNLTLTASTGLPKERPKESTTRPVNGTGGEPAMVDAGNASVVLTAKGDYQGETLIFTLFSAPPGGQANPPGHGAISRFADITSSISNDDIQKIRVTLRYTDADAAGIDEGSIRVYWWSATNSTWVALPGGVDTAANFAWGETDHFSTFGLFGVPPKGGGGGGSPGGGSSTIVTPKPPIIYKEKGSLNTNTEGVVTQSVEIHAKDEVASLFVPSGVKALDANGKPLIDLSIKPTTEEKAPAIPVGATYKFAGYIYGVGPGGATFDPAITLTFAIPEDAWNTLGPDNTDLTVKWYNEETGLWEDVPTTVSRSARSIVTKVTHFSIFALFTEPAIITTPTDTETPTTPPTAETPVDGLPMMTIFAIVAGIVVIVAAGYLLLRRS